jgi:uncharacterized membrane protein
MEYRGKSKGIGALKKEAREALKGKWGMAILVTFLATVISSAFSISGNISEGIDLISRDLFSGNFNLEQATQSTGSTILVNLGGLINLLIGGSIAYGISSFFLKLLRSENPQVENLFSGFKFFGRNFLIQLIIGIFAVLWSLLVWIPAMIVAGIILFISFSTLTFSLNGEVSPSAITSGAFGTIAVIVLLFIICAIITYLIVLRYSMSYYIYIDNPHYTVMECITTSKEMMKGNKVRLFTLHLSFIGWHILSILTVFIGYLWLKPYINAADASFYNDLKGIAEPEENKEPTVSLYKEQTSSDEI